MRTRHVVVFPADGAAGSHDVRRWTRTHSSVRSDRIHRWTRTAPDHGRSAPDAAAPAGVPTGAATWVGTPRIPAVERRAPGAGLSRIVPHRCGRRPAPSARPAVHMATHGRRATGPGCSPAIRPGPRSAKEVGLPNTRTSGAVVRLSRDGRRPARPAPFVTARGGRGSAHRHGCKRSAAPDTVAALSARPQRRLTTASASRPAAPGASSRNSEGSVSSSSTSSGSPSGPGIMSTRA